MIGKRVWVRLHYAYLRFIEEGISWSLCQLIARAYQFLIYFLLLPAILFLRVMGYRFLTINTARIGHLAGEIDCFLKLQILGVIDVRYKYFIFKGASICNYVFWDYIKNKVSTVDCPILCRILGYMCAGPGIRFNVSDYLLAINQAAKYYEVCRCWGERPSLFALEENHTRFGVKTLNDLGVPIGAPFICIHVRSPGYSEVDDTVHSHRNFSVETFDKAINEIINRGYYCILMGESSSPKIRTSKMVIDYAHSDHRSDLMDVFLCGSAKFFLGNSSGLFILSTVFGVPCALTNMLPFTCTGFTHKDISIPKLLRRKGEKNYLTCSEIIFTGIANFRNSNQYSRNSLEVISNTSDDILNLVHDMFAYTDGNISDAEIKNITTIFLDKLQPDNYCFKTSSHLAPSFIKKYKDIFK